MKIEDKRVAIGCAKVGDIIVTDKGNRYLLLDSRNGHADSIEFYNLKKGYIEFTSSNIFHTGDILRIKNIKEKNINEREIIEIRETIMEIISKDRIKLVIE